MTWRTSGKSKTTPIFGKSTRDPKAPGGIKHESFYFSDESIASLDALLRRAQKLPPGDGNEAGANFIWQATQAAAVAKFDAKADAVTVRGRDLVRRLEKLARVVKSVSEETNVPGIREAFAAGYVRVAGKPGEGVTIEQAVGLILGNVQLFAYISEAAAVEAKTRIRRGRPGNDQGAQRLITELAHCWSKCVGLVPSCATNSFFVRVVGIVLPEAHMRIDDANIRDLVRTAIVESEKTPRKINFPPATMR